MTPRVWIVQVNPSILGPVVPQARPKGGTYRSAADLPPAVREYLNLPESRTVRPRMQDFATIAEVEALALDEHLVRRTRRRHGVLLLTIRLPESSLPPPQRRPSVPAGIPAIRSLRQLCAYFSADSPRSLNRRVYKDTDCGASISLQLRDGTWLHNGAAGWDTLDLKTPIRGFTIQTIVEGSDAEVNSDLFAVPVRESEVAEWLVEMEAEADRLWHDANDTDTVDI